MLQGPDIFTTIPAEMFGKIVEDLSLKDRTKLSTVHSVFREYVYKLNNRELMLDFDVEENIYSTPERFKLLLASFPKLRFVHLAPNKDLAEYAKAQVPSLADPNTMILSMHHTLVTHDQFFTFATLFPSLTELNLAWCNKFITNTTFQELPSFFPNLKTLKMRACHAISRETFLETIGKMENLEYLDLSWNPQILNEDALSRAAPLLANLKTLCLDYNTEIPREHFITLVKQLINLEELSLDGCLQFDDNTLLTMMEFLPKLTKLNLYRVEFLSDGALMTIAANHPTMTILLNKSGDPKIDKSKFSSMAQIKFI